VPRFLRRFASAPLFALPLLALATSLAACGDAGNGAEPEPIARASDALFANDKAMYDYFVGKGLTSFQAAGIVGNLDQESGGNPNAVQSGGPGRGIAQWSVGGRWDTDANDNATAYASKKGVSVWTLQLQLDFIWYELTTFSGYGLAQLKATTNVTDATVVFQNKFEGCGTCVQTQRVQYAKDVLAAYGATPSYAAQFVSQSFPYATTTLTMTAGQVIPSYIELKNVGSKTWDSKTRLATTQARDRASAFADATWISSSRLAAVSGTVPPGGTYKFTFDLAAPSKLGTYDEFFGVVEDGVAWFSDPGQGGPQDNQLEVKIQVVAAPASDAGTGTDAGKDAGADAATSDAGHPGSDAALVDAGADGAIADDATAGETGTGHSDLAASTEEGAGCSVRPTRGGSTSGAAFGFAIAIGAIGAIGAARGRRRRAG
jgi:hypothetical protein